MSVRRSHHARAQLTEYGFFAQDTWRFRPNLTLTAVCVGKFKVCSNP